MSRQDVDALLGARMRELRLARKLTLDQIASKTGVSPQMVSKYEFGRSPMTGQRIYDVAAALDVTVADLFAKVPSPGTE